MDLSFKLEILINTYKLVCNFVRQNHSMLKQSMIMFSRHSLFLCFLFSSGFQSLAVVLSVDSGGSEFEVGLLSLHFLGKSGNTGSSSDSWKSIDTSSSVLSVSFKSGG